VTKIKNVKNVFYIYGRDGGAEDARRENDGQTKIVDLENAGLENDGQTFSKNSERITGSGK